MKPLGARPSRPSRKASRSSPCQDVVRDGVTGLHFRSGDPDDLARQTTRFFGEPEQAAAMGRAARREYETAYTAERNYDLLMRIYQEALACRTEADRGFAALPVESH